MRRSTGSELTPLVRSWLSIIALRADSDWAASCPAGGRSSTIVTALISCHNAGRAFRTWARAGQWSLLSQVVAGPPLCKGQSQAYGAGQSTGRRAASMNDMVTIREEDLIESVADALQFISYYHPMDYIRALGEAYAAEQGPAAKDAIAQILTNSRMCAEGHRPICQDTGIVNVFVKWGQECRLASARSLQEVVDEGVRRAYNHPENKLRASILADPAFTRRNTRDNTPCVLAVEMVPGRTVSIDVAAKGGGSENKSKFKMMNPSDSIVDWVLEMVPQMGAGWCPPGMLGIGIGGTAEHAVKLAKMSLMEPIDMGQLKARGPANDLEALRIEIFDKVNALGIGAQGLGGLSTVLDVKIKDWPCHAAGKPVAMIPNCAATRHAHFTLDGSGPAYLPLPDLEAWPKVA